MTLKQKAIDMANIYRMNPKVEAILLAGSVALGWEDDFSDIELHIFWNEAPTERERMAPIQSVQGKILAFHPYEDNEWSESYVTKDGIKLEISNFLTVTINSFIQQVVVGFDTNTDKQCLLASIVDGEGIVGKKLIQEFKRKSSLYPSELSEKMIIENLELGSRWTNRRALLKRQDWLMFYTVLCDVQKRLMGVLFGLNSIYVHHPEFKWMSQKVKRLKVKPDDFQTRLEAILLDSPEKSLDKLEELVKEVYMLVEIHKPGINLDTLKTNISFAK